MSTDIFHLSSSDVSRDRSCSISENKNQATITAVLQRSRFIRVAAGSFEVAECWAKELLRRYRYEGEVADQDFDAGAEIIEIYLRAEGLRPPTKTIGPREQQPW